MSDINSTSTNKAPPPKKTPASGYNPPPQDMPKKNPPMPMPTPKGK